MFENKGFKTKKGFAGQSLSGKSFFCPFPVRVERLFSHTVLAFLLDAFLFAL